MSTLVQPPPSADPLTPEVAQRVRSVLRDTFFAKWSAGYTDTPAGARDLEDHAVTRYHACLRQLAPWIGRHVELAESTVVELGCGTGASTAALALRCRRISGYDVDSPALEAARARLQLMGLTNADVTLIAPESESDVISAAHPEPVDVVLCYAVLEHCTIAERDELISMAWRLLRPGGLLVVADTPNRIGLFDYHTTQLPFYHFLPDELAIWYARRAPRQAFADDLARAEPAARPLILARWGRGVSYHEFERALGLPLEQLTVADGFEDEILSVHLVMPEERLLATYWQSLALTLPLAFVRATLNFILRKPAPGDDPAALVAESARRQADRFVLLTGTNPRPSAEAGQPQDDLMAMTWDRNAWATRATVLEAQLQQSQTALAAARRSFVWRVLRRLGLVDRTPPPTNAA